MKNLVIDKTAIKNNVGEVKLRAKGAEIIADLAGDAYGMGLLETARILRDEGIMSFAIDDPRDAQTLRRAGFTEEKLMMLRSTADAEELRQLLDLGVIVTIGSYDAAVAVNGIAAEHSTVCEVQIKIDTGLGRYGFMPDELDKVVSIYKYMPNLAVVGVFSAYAQSWCNKKLTMEQLDLFNDVLARLHAQGYETGLTHICDSAALFRYDSDGLGAVRVDSAFAGRVPGGNTPGLIKVGYIEASVEEVGRFPKGHHVGGEILKKSKRLAVLSVGYYHGFGVDRYENEMSFWKRLFYRRKRPVVKIDSQRVKLVGGIGMMYCVVDVDKAACQVGDVAVLDVDPVDVKGLERRYE